jgi:hypothetical protein
MPQSTQRSATTDHFLPAALPENATLIGGNRRNILRQH